MSPFSDMFSSAKVNLEDCDEDFSVSEGVQIFPSFKKMGLKPELLRGIYDFGKLMQILFNNSYFRIRKAITRATARNQSNHKET